MEISRYLHQLLTITGSLGLVFVGLVYLDSLAGSNRAFEHGTLQLFQVLFSRSGMNAIPRTRAHLYASGE